METKICAKENPLKVYIIFNTLHTTDCYSVISANQQLLTLKNYYFLSIACIFTITAFEHKAEAL